MSLAPSPAFSEYVGVPYVDHGRSPEGWDCYGLVYYISRHVLGLPVPSYLNAYPDAEDCPHVRSAIEYHAKEWREVQRGEIAQGDTLVFNICGMPIHCGLAFSRELMLHCLAGHETVFDRIDGARWRSRIAGVYRWT